MTGPEFDWQAYEAEFGDLTPPDPSPVPALPTPGGRTGTDRAAPVDGAALLAELHAAVLRYLVMPSPESTDAVVLWIAATHAQPAWEHATRLGITGPAKRCGKSRLLEIIKATSHNVLPAVNASTAALYRSIGGDDPPTVLFDEADAIFGTKRQAEANEDLRALLNAGHSRGWPVLRCVGPNQEVKAFASFAMAAIAGIGDLPDTITDRAVNIRMRRRAPHETVKPFRTVRDTPALHAIRNRLNRWVRAHLPALRAAEPPMPVEDRAADTWESLIAIADHAGADWPERARLACKTLTEAAADNDTDTSGSLRLLADLRTGFTDTRKLHTATILDRLRAITDSPWATRELTSHELSKMLRVYGIHPKNVRETGTGPVGRGYDLADLTDAFTRYLPPLMPDGAAPVADVAVTEPEPLQIPPALTSDVTDVADVAAPPPTDPTPPAEHPEPDEPPDAGR
ncbi:hypothetical protein DMB66_27750 [Actinoplanes sp. ATCC 53533]|uniref:DUF3631 domain-containing protein n=1 Tax=Actinoplanes sp. ATCC 53533 TaxID=1288362 RepID=UPI000F76BA7E|nr:DUF3631 domain-containing protein [Actinoplanes sp. ATCC 53533]RSM59482.1 hypothetical protein DMB66_27750 [Actinoplanes sp. ATCC 53533]